jgi:hypothetical protein
LTFTKGAFPNEDSLLKLLYMGIQNAKKEVDLNLYQTGGITLPHKMFHFCVDPLLSQLTIFFEGRLEKAL